MSLFKGRKVPVILQIEAAECGAASLCMVLGYYGRHVPLTDMRRDCRVSRDGTSLNNIMKAAEKHGLEAKAFRMGTKQLRKITLPAILFWKNSHYVVLERIDDKSAVICDPAAGRRRIDRSVLDENYSRIMLQLKPEERFETSGKKYSPFTLIKSMLKGTGKMILYLSILIIILNLTGLVVPGLITLYIDYYLPAAGDGNALMYFSVFGAVIILQALLMIYMNRIILAFDRAESDSFHYGIFDRLMRLPLEYFQSRSSATMLARLFSVDSLARFVSVDMIPLGLGFIFSIVYLALIFHYSIIIGIIISVFVVGVLAVMLTIMAKTNEGYICAENCRNSLYGNVIENIRVFDTLKASAKEDMAAENAINAYADYANSIMDIRRRECTLEVIPGIVPVVIQVICFIVGAALMVHGNLTMGTMLACQSLGMSVFGPVSQFIFGFNNIRKQESNIRGIDDILSSEEDSLNSSRKDKGNPEDSGRIEAEEVSFSYNTSLEPVVKGISFSVEKGKCLGIAGKSGSGKSTVLKILEGLYVPDQGTVRASGSVASVSQNPYIFRGTVLENVTLFDDSITRETAMEALKDACLHEDVMKRKNGPDEMIERENCRFSGGQIQRIMIARALVTKPDILILDEATSALDTIVEEEVMSNIRKKGITCIIVAHRLSTIRDCDEIIVMDKGLIADRGTHQEMIVRKTSPYRELLNSEEFEN